jgi:hypothetical protein
MELSLYCLPRAFHSLFEKLLNKFEIINSKTRLNYGVYLGNLLFSIAITLIIVKLI